MTIHPEDAMTRERALEDALRKIAEHPHRDGESRNIAKAALASAQQEPAPAADAEEVAWTVTDEICGHALPPEESRDMWQMRAKWLAINKIVSAALRRCAGDGGVTKRLDLLERYVASVAMWMDRENVTDQERLSYIKGHPVTRAATRAKSGGKGGAR